MWLLRPAALSAVICFRILAALFVLVLIALIAEPAFAQAVSSQLVDAGTVVTVPVGDWATHILDLAGAVLVASLAGLIATAVHFLPSWLRPLISTAMQNALAGYLKQGINYAIQTVEGSEKGKTMDLNVGSAVVAVALQYAIDHAPAFLINLAGGDDELREKIIALLGDLEMWLAPNVSPAAVKTQAEAGPAAAVAAVTAAQ